jgi:hypothetical protein
MYQEDAERREHERELVAIEDDRRRHGVWGAGHLPVAYPYNGYVVLCIDEPIQGLPSHRIYGPLDDRTEATKLGKEVNERSEHLTVAVLPLRQVAQMMAQEK